MWPVAPNQSLTNPFKLCFMALKHFKNHCRDWFEVPYWISILIPSFIKGGWIILLTSSLVLQKSPNMHTSQHPTVAALGSCTFLHKYLVLLILHLIDCTDYSLGRCDTPPAASDHSTGFRCGAGLQMPSPPNKQGICACTKKTKKNTNIYIIFYPWHLLPQESHDSWLFWFTLGFVSRI